MARVGGQVSVGNHLDTIPEDEAGFTALLAELRARPHTDGLLLSADGRRALFSLPLSDLASVDEAVRRIEAYSAEIATDDYEVLVGGPLVAETMLGEKVLLDLSRLVPLMLVAISVLLYAMLRTSGGVMIPMLETLIVLIWTFGAMGWAGAPIALVTTILPVVLMALCITDEIHLLERLMGRWDAPTMRARIEAAIDDVGRPIVLTSLTTSLGFLSFTSTSIEPLREFGVFAAFGILAAMVLTFSLIPALLILLPERLFAPTGVAAGGRGLDRYGRLAGTRPGLCFGIGIAAVAIALPGLANLRVSDSWVLNFDPDDDIVRAERAINESFWGSYRFDVVLEGPPGFFASPSERQQWRRSEKSRGAHPTSVGPKPISTPSEELAATLGADGPLSGLPIGQLWDLFTLVEMSESRALLRAPRVRWRGCRARAPLRAQPRPRAGDRAREPPRRDPARDRAGIRTARRTTAATCRSPLPSSIRSCAVRCVRSAGRF